MNIEKLEQWLIGEIEKYEKYSELKYKESCKLRPIGLGQDELERSVKADNKAGIFTEVLMKIRREN